MTTTNGTMTKPAKAEACSLGATPVLLHVPHKIAEIFSCTAADDSTPGEDMIACLGEGAIANLRAVKAEEDALACPSLENRDEAPTAAAPTEEEEPRQPVASVRVALDIPEPLHRAI